MKSATPVSALAALKGAINRSTNMEGLGEAGDGQKAIAPTRKLLPDLVLMDVKMQS